MSNDQPFNAAAFLAELDRPKRPRRKHEFQSEHSLDFLAHEISKLWTEVEKFKAAITAWQANQRRGNNA